MLNLAELENLTGITFKTLKKRLKSLEATREGLYSTKEALPLLYAQKQGEDHNLIQEKTRLAKAQADKIELEIEKMEEKLIDSEIWCDHWGKAIVSFKDMMNNIALKFSGTLANTSDVNEIYALLSSYSREALEAIAKEAHERQNKLNEDA